MTIEFIDEESEDGECFHSIELECNPFKVREVIKIEVVNKDKKMWNVEEISQNYTIVDISHHSNTTYHIKKYGHFTTFIIVKKAEKIN